MILVFICIIVVVFIVVKMSKQKKAHQGIVESLQLEISEMQQRQDELGVTEYYQLKDRLDSLKIDVEENENSLESLKNTVAELSAKSEKLEKSIGTQSRKVSRIKELYKSMEYAINNFTNSPISLSDCLLPENDLTEIEEISPSVILKLHSMDVKDLRKAYKENDKEITKVLEMYSDRYTTKANKAIYKLMVIALRAELQNILSNLKYEKLDKALDDVKAVTSKYLKIASDGNQQIAGTLTKFIGQIEYLFSNAAKIEYNYYVKKEQARQEQLAIREQMRQEAEERKALEAEKKKIEKEELKFKNEIEKINSMMDSASESEIESLKARLMELESQLSDVALKKDEITNLQNGKAGNVYIISNLGSFGDDVFKIGMTRRLDPQDRINELGSASVPFKFDVHSFIFSDDAVGLEKSLHDRLNDKRVNKVNLRKEFFRISIDELEELVSELDSTAEFNRTMIAEEYNQSLSSDENYTSSYSYEDDFNEDDEENESID